MDIERAYRRLGACLGGRVLRDERMSGHTTYRIGGPAAIFAECGDVSELGAALSVLCEERIPHVVIGKGSNLLVADSGYEGAVLILGEGFSRVSRVETADADDRPEDSGESEESGLVRICAGAAVPLARLVQRAYGTGLSGLEFAIGIPGTVGGAIFMNAGTRDTWIGSVVDTVTSYVAGDGLRIRHGGEIAWGYRSSGLPEDETIVEATLDLRAADPDAVRRAMEERLAWRKSHQPLGMPSCGSVFKNPPEGSVGRMIAECGLQGTRCGGAEVSRTHANFIVNTGSASAEDVLELMHLAQARVKERYGVELRPEVKLLGFPE